MTLADALLSPIWRTAESLWRTALVLIGLVPVLPLVALDSVRRGPSAALRISSLARCCARAPLGMRVLSGFVGVSAPYSASIGALIRRVDGGSVEASMTERPWLRNPFASIHALALANLGELTSGLAAVNRIDLASMENVAIRGIVTSLSCSYQKKARGTIVCRADVPPLPSSDGEHALQVTARLTDAAGDQVALFTATWRLSIAQRRPKAT